MADPRVIFKILAENAQAKKVLNETAGAFDKLQSGAGKLAVPAAAALGGIALFGMDAAKSASDVEQSFGALESVFGDTSGQAKDMARSASKDVGMSSAAYAQMAAQLGAQLKNMGVPADEVLGLTDDLIKKGADLSATFGGDTSDAVAALSSLLRGERDPIEKYGVSIKDAGIEALIGKDNLKKMTDEQKTAAKTQATLALLTDQTADAQGAFARESDTAAHAQQVANAKFEDAKAALGTALLPVIVLVADAFATLAGWVSENTQLVQIIVGVIAGLAAAILIVNAAFAAWGAISAIVTAAQWLLNAALLANPIGLIIIAVLALVAGFILLWNNCEAFREIVTAVFGKVLEIIRGAVDFIIGVFNTVAGVLEAPFNAFLGVIRSVFKLVQSIIDLAMRAISTIFTKAVDAFKVIFGPVQKILTGPFEAAKKIIGDVFKALEGIVRRVIDNITGWLDGISDTISGVADFINGIGRSAPVHGTPGAAPRVAGLRSARAGVSRSGPITVNVYTTGDSMQAEQAVLKALRRQTRLNGGVVPAFGWNAG